MDSWTGRRRYPAPRCRSSAGWQAGIGSPARFEELGTVGADPERADRVELEAGCLGNAGVHGLVDECLVADKGRVEPMQPYVLGEDDWVAVVGAGESLYGIRCDDGRSEHPVALGIDDDDGHAHLVHFLEQHDGRAGLPGALLGQDAVGAGDELEGKVHALGDLQAGGHGVSSGSGLR